MSGVFTFQAPLLSSFRAPSTTAQRFVSAILDHIEELSCDDIRPGLRTSTFKKRTLIVYVVDGPIEDPTINVVGVFHGGQDWERALADPQD